MAWLQITVETDASNAGHWSDTLTESGAVAVTMQDAANREPLFEIPNEQPSLWQKTRLIGLYESTEDMKLVATFLKENLPLQNLPAVEAVEDKDWQTAWKANFKPIFIGTRLCICPSWLAAPKDAEALVWLDPGLAFGTGTHPTTQMCLTWLEANVMPHHTIIDYGCGSGILGIAALKLQANFCYAVDCDELALQTTKKNAELNNCNPLQYHLLLDTDFIANPKTADILVANILAEPLLELQELFSNSVKPGGFLVLSGILDTQLDKILILYSFTFENFTVHHQEEWVAIACQRKSV